MGKQINNFIKNLTDTQIDRLMEVMTDYSLSATEAVVLAYDYVNTGKK